MIDILLAGLGLVFPGAGILGVAGVVIKVLGKFFPAAAATVTSNPIFAFIAKISEGFVDLVVWAAKGVLSYVGAWLAGGFDHISKDARSFAILMAVAWGSYQIGGVGRPVLESPPATKSAPAKVAPATSKQPASDPFDWITNALGL